ncbi:hypothetical protein pEaSNUABM37_00040 [Erwinia phage pEa_SNUABM_37]|nr:hypothetical protein pEaSNUABM37_00040 [Erwinia phage pEa_SNUABM_37]QXO10510.1 hypothetical protein pEaSNUABM48_00040 [Erwinia phage pEa_SNUABM_48]
MLEHAMLIVGVKFIVSCTIVLIAERQQSKPYYYLCEIILGSAVIAVVPLLGHVALYFLTAYNLRQYPYGIIRAWLWPVELYRSAYKYLFRRYPFRKL